MHPVNHEKHEPIYGNTVFHGLHVKPRTYTKNVAGVTTYYAATVTLLCSNIQDYAFKPPSCRPNPNTIGVPVCQYC